MISSSTVSSLACLSLLFLTVVALFLIDTRNRLLAMSVSSPKHPVYSLWLSPSPTSPASPILSSLISSLPGPRIQPHATLLGSVPDGMSLDQVKSKVQDAVDDWKRSREKVPASEKAKGGLTVEFEDVRKGEEYFRCVLVKLRDSSTLHSLHNHLLSHLPSPSERPTYFPHISLLYSDIPQSERQFIVNELYSSLRARSVNGRGSGVKLFADGEEKNENKGASEVWCDRISIVQTKGVEVEDWKASAEIVI